MNCFTVAHKQALHERVIRGLRLGPKENLAPDSPAKDLIRASYPSRPEARGELAQKQTGLLQDSLIDPALLPEPLHIQGGDRVPCLEQ